MPTFFAKVAQGIDPYQRIQETFGAETGVPDALAYRIPGVSMGLPARTTALGEKAEKWATATTEKGAIGGLLNAIQATTSVTPVSAVREGADVERELNRLRHYGDVPPSSPRRTKKLVLKGTSGENVKLTDEEYAIYDRYHKMAKTQTDRVIKAPGYQRLPDDQKAKYLRRIYDKYRRIANKQITIAVRRRTTPGL